ncbi:MAG: CCXG family PEP-CTERM protein [Myxococcota bacterium]
MGIRTDSHTRRAAPGRARGGPLALLLTGIAAALLAPASAGALSFQVDFTSTTYQAQAGDTWADLLAEHQSGALIAGHTLDGLAGISPQTLAGGTNGDYSLLMTTVVEVQVAGQYQFQVGTDWGRGGAAVVIDNDSGLVIDEVVRTDDLWWNNDWNNPDVFTTSLALDAGTSYTLGWVGFEGCCGGSATIRFAFEGGGFQDFTSPNADAYMIANPEPGTAVLVMLGLGGLSAFGRKRLRA